MISYRVVSGSKVGCTLYADGLHTNPVKIAGNEDLSRDTFDLLTDVASYFNQAEKSNEEKKRLLEQLLTACFKQEEVNLELLLVADKVAKRLSYPDLRGFLSEKLPDWRHAFKPQGEKPE